MALNTLFGGVYVGRRVLITGHTGFKGSWLALWLHSMGAQVTGLALDPDTAPSHWNLLGLGDLADYRVDLRNAQAVRDVFELQRPEMVFHLAAQPLVRRSYREPARTFDVNVMGLVYLLEAVRDCPSVRTVVNVTTDKVYEERVVHGGYRETDPLGGHDPYSSSKACAEIVSASYHKSFFGLGHDELAPRLATARAGNVIGGGDWAEDRLVPDLVRAAVTGNPLKIRNPNSTRPWQHVLDPLSGYLRLGQALLQDSRYADSWNFGPDRKSERSVQDVVSLLCTHWSDLRVEADSRNHPHEAATLHLNCEKASQQLAWRPTWDLETAVARTGAWYRSYCETGVTRSADDLAIYIGDARSDRLEWAS